MSISVFINKYINNINKYIKVLINIKMLKNQVPERDAQVLFDCVEKGGVAAKFGTRVLQYG